MDRDKTCGTKHKLRSHGATMAQLRSLVARGDQDLDAYLCTFCKYWHVGHVGRKKRSSTQSSLLEAKMRWYKSAGQYGSWIAPDGTVEVAHNMMEHEVAGRRVLGRESKGMSREEVYDALLQRGYLRVVNGPPIAIECKDFNEQAGQILAATAHLSPEAQVIMEMWGTQVWPEGDSPGTAAMLRTEFSQAPTASDVLGRGGQSDPWREDEGGGFSVFESCSSKEKSPPNKSDESRKNA